MGGTEVDYVKIAKLIVVSQPFSYSPRRLWVQISIRQGVKF
jgi:hypothetical protein